MINLLREITICLNSVALAEWPVIACHTREYSRRRVIAIPDTSNTAGGNSLYHPRYFRNVVGPTLRGVRGIAGF